MRTKRTIAAALLLAGALLPAGCADRGRELFAREGCGNCHRFRDLGGGLAPDLSDVARRRDAASIRAQIREPAPGPASRMPAFGHLSSFDLRSLAAFLRS